MALNVEWEKEKHQEKAMELLEPTNTHQGLTTYIHRNKRANYYVPGTKIKYFHIPGTHMNPFW
jgi:hypothetical protein